MKKLLQSWVGGEVAYDRLHRAGMQVKALGDVAGRAVLQKVSPTDFEAPMDRGGRLLE
ncbi:MAG TPA: hypothetical protein VE844_09550 [Gammaproteobacteria bacterium]|nr:hypothetical protein [Gammaproteobacteria bacterium]